MNYDESLYSPITPLLALLHTLVLSLPRRHLFQRLAVSLTVLSLPVTLLIKLKEASARRVLSFVSRRRQRESRLIIVTFSTTTPAFL